MKMNTSLSLAVMAMAMACVATTVNASPVSGFGSIPGAGTDVYSGSGIPQDTSTWTQTMLPGASTAKPGDTLTLSLAATQHGSFNPAPGNNGIDTYSVGTGLNAGRSLWNYDFYARSDAGNVSAYSFLLTETSDRTGLSFSFNPLLIPDNVGAPGAFGNSESLDFASLGLPIGYDANQDDTFHFTLDAFLNDRKVASDNITVIAGGGAPTHSVPDGGATAGLMGIGLAGVGLVRRKLAK